MTWVEVLVEGASDVPVVREVLQRKFGLTEGEHFRIHPHRGKGVLPTNPLAIPDPRRQGLLDQLPAKLRGYGRSLLPDHLVLVVVDVDNEPCHQLLEQLNAMVASLPTKPKVLFRLAIEETESWFLADLDAVQRAYPAQFKKDALKGIKPDQVVALGNGWQGHWVWIQGPSARRPSSTGPCGLRHTPTWTRLRRQASRN